MNESYQVCKRCVMDTSAANIFFDGNGFCNYCTEFLERLERDGLTAPSTELKALLRRIKNDGRGREYDCIIGLSGGIDSSYVLYLAIRNGLRPLAVHLDNGWNSELAVHNISNLVRSLGVDLYTHVIDWNENRDLQKSFFKANVIDIEMLMDNAMIAINYRIARQHHVKWILTGVNRSTEGMHMPSNWNWLKFDARNIRHIHSCFGSLPIKTHPLISLSGLIWNKYVLRKKWISFLDYFNYRKEEALATLQQEVGYRPYLYKHYESVFTRFYQGYILPRKFGVDKRKLHLSTLITTGQMHREDALRLIQESPYPNFNQEREDYEYVLKKLGFSREEFEQYVALPAVPHDTYRSEKLIWDLLYRSYKYVNGLRNL